MEIHETFKGSSSGTWPPPVQAHPTYLWVTGSPPGFAFSPGYSVWLTGEVSQGHWDTKNESVGGVTLCDSASHVLCAPDHTQRWEPAPAEATPWSTGQTLAFVGVPGILLYTVSRGFPEYRKHSSLGRWPCWSADSSSHRPLQVVHRKALPPACGTEVIYSQTGRHNGGA